MNQYQYQQGDPVDPAVAWHASLSGQPMLTLYLAGPYMAARGQTADPNFPFVAVCRRHNAAGYVSSNEQALAVSAWCGGCAAETQQAAQPVAAPPQPQPQQQQPPVMVPGGGAAPSNGAAETAPPSSSKKKPEGPKPTTEQIQYALDRSKVLREEVDALEAQIQVKKSELSAVLAPLATVPTFQHGGYWYQVAGRMNKELGEVRYFIKGPLDRKPGRAAKASEGTT